MLYFYFFFSSRRRHTRLQGDWSSDVCSSDLGLNAIAGRRTDRSGCLPTNVSRRSGERWRSAGEARPRSEERRVGKECRSRWWRSSEKKKKKRGVGSRRQSTTIIETV